MLHRSLLPRARALGGPLPVARPRGRRRVPPLPRGLRRPRRPGAAAAAARVRLPRRPTRRSCSRRPPSAIPAEHASRLTGLDVMAVSHDDSPRGEVALVALGAALHVVRRRERRAGASCGVLRVGRPAGGPGQRGRADPRVRPVAAGCRAGRDHRPPDCWPRSTRRCRGASRATAAATSPRSGGRSSRRCATGGCWASPRPTRSSSASTSRGWTPCWSPASPAPAPRGGSRSAGPGATPVTPSPCWSPATTRWTPIWSPTRRRCSTRRWSRRSSTRATPTSLGPHLCAAAQEVPLREPELALFGPHGARLVDELTEAGRLRAGLTGGTGPTPSPPAPSPTSAPGAARRSPLVEADTGRVVGTVDGAQRPRHRPRRGGLRPPRRDLAGRVARPRRPRRDDRAGRRRLLHDRARADRHHDRARARPRAWGEAGCRSARSR